MSDLTPPVGWEQDVAHAILVVRKELLEYSNKNLVEAARTLQTLWRTDIRSGDGERERFMATLSERVTALEKVVDGLDRVVREIIPAMKPHVEVNLPELKAEIRLPELPPAQVNVNLPEMQPSIHIASPEIRPEFNVHVPEQPQPAVNVEVKVPENLPQVYVEAPRVTVAAPEVRPEIHVQVPAAKPITKHITYDEYGRPVMIVEGPVQEENHGGQRLRGSGEGEDANDRNG